MSSNTNVGRRVLVIAAMTLVTWACTPPVIALFPPTPTPTATPGLVPDLLTPEAPTLGTPAPTLPRPQMQPTPTATATATPDFAYPTGEIRLYPGPLHYSGDLLTIEVDVENAQKLGDLSRVTVRVDNLQTPLRAKPFLDESPLRDDTLVFRWVWDTSGLIGLHQLTVTLPAVGAPDTQRISAHVNLLPSSERPSQEVNARWDVRNTACCRLRFVTHTAAERDIFSLADRANRAVLAVEQELGFPVSSKPIPLTFIDVEWGNGAYTSGEIVMSYVDRDYTGIDFDTVLKHEIVHWSMRSVGERVPLLLAEGVAVYASGGHYKPEPLPERGAAVIDLNEYVPLTDLADDFRSFQHEVAYAEAGAFVDYLVETYGWGKFLAVYGAEGIEGGGSHWLDQAFRQEYQKGLGQIERDYRVWLGKHTAGSQTADLRLTVELFDTMRRYQAHYAPYQESLPASDDAVDAGHTAEFLRESTAPENIALEVALRSAAQALRDERFTDVETILAAINAAIDSGDFTLEPVGDYLAIARTLAAAGYEGQAIVVAGDTATARVIRTWPRLETLHLVRAADKWEIVPEESTFLKLTIGRDESILPGSVPPAEFR